MCIDNDSSSSYRLHGCPTVFYNTMKNTSGVCTNVTADNITDLLLTANELELGLHSFDCSNTTAPNGMVSSIAIVG